MVSLRHLRDEILTTLFMCFSAALRTNQFDNHAGAIVKFRFLYFADYLLPGSTFLFREGRAKGAACFPCSTPSTTTPCLSTTLPRVTVTCMPLVQVEVTTSDPLSAFLCFCRYRKSSQGLSNQCINCRQLIRGTI